MTDRFLCIQDYPNRTCSGCTSACWEPAPAGCICGPEGLCDYHAATDTTRPVHDRSVPNTPKGG